MAAQAFSIKTLLDRQGSDKGRWYGGLYDALLRPCREDIPEASPMFTNPLPGIKARKPTAQEMVKPGGADRHLGGYASHSDIGDFATYYPSLWTWAVAMFGIRSVIDVGCGEGRSTAFFADLGCEVLGVEGYTPAIEASPVRDTIVQHDYTTGPYVPPRAFDMAWSCEFVEHVDERHMENFFATFAQCQAVFMTFAAPGQGGHHHVNEQPEDYWVDQFRRRGFRRDADATQCARLVAQADRYLLSPEYPAHFTVRGLVFFREPA